MLDLSLQGFEDLDGLRPFTLLDEHPDGCLVVLQVADSPLNRAAVWNKQTGKVVWKPDNAIAMHWLKRGQQIVLVRENYHLDPTRFDGTRHPIIATPTQSEINYVCERESWPDHLLLGRSGIKLEEGWIDQIAVAPQNDLAAISWLEQDAAGFVLVRFAAEGDYQLEGAGYRTAPDNLMHTPVFSPDGRFVVASCGRNLWWADDTNDPATPAQGGTYTLGHVAIYNVATGMAVEFLIEEEIPAGWRPSDPEHPLDWELLGKPEFVNDLEFAVALSIGKERRFSVT